MKPILLLLAFALSPSLSTAETLPDPTRPRLPAAAALAASGASGVPGANAAPGRPVLQGLRLGARPSAVINGQLLRPGQKLDGYTLLRLDAEAAVVVDAEGRQHRIPLLDSVASNPRKEVRP